VCPNQVRAVARARATADGEGALLAKIAEMSEPDRAMAEWLHAIATASAPVLAPRTWYGMQACCKPATASVPAGTPPPGDPFSALS
jgi:hypothetical protein